MVNSNEAEVGYVSEKLQFVEFFSSTCLACMISKPIIENLEEGIKAQKFTQAFIRPTLGGEIYSPQYYCVVSVFDSLRREVP